MPLTLRMTISFVAAALSAGPALAGALDGNPAHEPAAPGVQDLIVQQAHDHGVPVGLAKAVIRIESRGNPRARNHGALGLMQIRAETARAHGFAGTAEALLAPATNLQYGMAVLADAYRASAGNVCRTLAFYQSGHRVTRFTHAQRRYCSQARAFMAAS